MTAPPGSLFKKHVLTQEKSALLLANPCNMYNQFLVRDSEYTALTQEKSTLLLANPCNMYKQFIIRDSEYTLCLCDLRAFSINI